MEKMRRSWPTTDVIQAISWLAHVTPEVVPTRCRMMGKVSSLSGLHQIVSNVGNNEDGIRGDN